eukprot:TRINITY_DN7974_c0_g1_i1.p1 TRINITY_DN7974_c0_g1~~TRINITY_DN7974_c0_g1_i1.p1  ORF type:complete len:579 (+),score=141.22 TRINITY_DN7974_c0_g1_i1:139-1875(+)
MKTLCSSALAALLLAGLLPHLARAYWTLNDGDCEVSYNDCLQSPGYPANYPSYSECVVMVRGSYWNNKQIKVNSFNTEGCCDILTVNGEQYSDQGGPDGVTPSGIITFSSDDAVEREGWQLCPEDAGGSASAGGDTAAEEDDEGGSGGVIAGVVVGILVCCCCVGFCFCMGSGSKSTSTSASKVTPAVECVVAEPVKVSVVGAVEEADDDDVDIGKSESIAEAKKEKEAREKAEKEFQALKQRVEEMNKGREQLASAIEANDAVLLKRAIAYCKEIDLPQSEIDLAQSKLNEMEQPSLFESKSAELRGWQLKYVTSSSEMQMLRQMMFVPDPRNLGYGRDVRESEAYKDLELLHAWKIEKPTKRLIYSAKKKQVESDISVLSDRHPLPTLDTKLDAATKNVGLDKNVNEKFLLHGTKPESVLTIIQNGLNERFSGGLFGSGIYVAEDPSKIDQYCTPDSDAPTEDDVKNLHTHLFGSGSNPAHPGRCFYAFAVRLTLGFPVYTKDGETNANGDGSSIFATRDKRELACVDDTTVHYHSLVAMSGQEREFKVKRHREFLCFDGDRTILEYLFCYRRVPK